MNLNYKLTFGKFKGETLKTVADKHSWYLNMIARVDWLVAKMRKELSKEDLQYLQKAQNKYREEQDIKWNNIVTGTYFSKSKYVDDDTNYIGMHGL